MQLRFAATLPALIWSSIATAAPETPLQPTDRWALDYGATQCTAARSYSSAQGPVVFGLVPSLDGNNFRLLINIPQPGPIYAKQLAGTADFGTGAIKTSVLYFGAKGVNQSMYQFNLPAAQMDWARSAQTLSVEARGGGRYTFALSEMPALLDALRKCTTDLQQHWNLDAKTQRTAELPSGDIRSIFTPKDYPREAAKSQPQGPSRYQLLIDEKGAVARCDVLVPSGIAMLDSTGCQVIQEKAKFRPALDTQGQPVRSVWTTPPITWGNAQNALNSGCTMVSSDSNSMINTCGQLGQNQGTLMQARDPTPAPPPPPPSSK
jgi:TonB family protein